MKKWILPLFVLLPACTTTTSYKFPTTSREVSAKYSLDRVIVDVKDAQLASRRFQRDLGFSAIDSKMMLATFQNGSTLEFKESSGHEGISGIRIRATSLDSLRATAEEKQIPFEEYELKDSNGRVYAQVLDFKKHEPLRLFSFVRYSMDYTTPTGFHRNNSVNLQEAWIVVDSLYSAEYELSRLGFEYSSSRILQPLRVNAKAIMMDDSALVFVERGHLEDRDKTHLAGSGMEAVGVSITVREIEGFAKSMEREKRIQFATTRYSNKSCILVPPKYTHGLWLELAKSAASTRNITSDSW